MEGSDEEVLTEVPREAYVGYQADTPTVAALSAKIRADAGLLRFQTSTKLISLCVDIITGKPADVVGDVHTSLLSREVWLSFLAGCDKFSNDINTYNAATVAQRFWIVARQLLDGVKDKHASSDLAPLLCGLEGRTNAVTIFHLILPFAVALCELIYVPTLSREAWQGRLHAPLGGRLVRS
jgi:hypothetical protein